MNTKNIKEFKELKMFTTAALAEIDRETLGSRVPIPSEEGVKEAKKWVDDNEK